MGAARLALLCTKADHLERMNTQPSKKKAMRAAKLVLLCSTAEHLEMMITHFSKKKAPAVPHPKGITSLGGRVSQSFQS